MQTREQKMKAILFGLVLLTIGFPAIGEAASISLVPTTSIIDVMPGDTVSVDVFIDFASVGGTLGGGFDLRWNAGDLNLLGFTSDGLGDPAFGRDPDVSTGLLESWGIGDFNGLFSGKVGSVDFEVLSSMGLSTIIALTPTNGIAGPFAGAVSFVEIPGVDYGSLEVFRAPSEIPLPAAFWLFGTALLGLIGVGKQRKK